jgi:hypothetical protein
LCLLAESNVRNFILWLEGFQWQLN